MGPQTILLGEAGASARLRNFEATLVVTPVAVDSLRYADSQFSLSWARGNIDFDALLGFRVGDQLTDLGATSRGWGGISAVAWLKPRVAAVLSGGVYPIDPTQGFPGGRFVSASIRFARGNERRAQSSEAVTPPASASSAEPAVIERFVWRRAGAHRVTLSVDAPRAQTVEVSGDFTGWTPVSLSTASDGSWTVTLPLEPG